MKKKRKFATNRYILGENSDRETEKIKTLFSSAANLPKDVLLGASIMTILSDTEVCIENYRGIIEYTDTVIRVKTKERQIKITGKQLKIEYYTNDEMKIVGKMNAVEFLK